MPFVPSAAVVAAACAIVIGSALPASAAEGAPAGVHVDSSFDSAQPTITVDSDGQPLGRATCPDRAFTAIPTKTTSVNGCNVIGTTNSTRVYYGWYVQRGNVKQACIWGKGFGSNRKPIWAELSCGTGRTKDVAWGNVAAAKQVQGMTAVGWAGVQWS